MRIYNTMTHSLVDFVPLKEGHVGLYACGPTVYDHAHVGHARAAVAFDILVRHLLALGLEVNYVRNYTDVDDKIINRSNEKKCDWRELSQTHIKSFEDDLGALECLRPTHTPRATEFIPQMLADISAIVDKGYAYATDGDVYFDVAAFPDYGKLSGRQTEDQEAGARVAVDDRKKNPADFALWKASKPGEPSWPSPWGPGRPGWHIECSTMSARLLGNAFDIHGGGQDLIFPHHENELAQSKALDRPMANIWAHNGFVNINNEKMSKSLGNFFTIKDILKVCPAEILRYFLVTKHYRSPIEFSDEGLKEAGKALERIYRTLAAAKEALKGERVEPTAEQAAESRQLKEKFTEAMNDDLNTAQAMGYVFDMVHLLNRHIGQGQKGEATAVCDSLMAAGEELGLWRQDPEVFFNNLQTFKGTLPAAEIEELVAKRNEARARKDWPEADRLRQQLLDNGVILEDKAGQTTWRLA
jgi:cysteinyl-tRNA synthetase